jgi:hypothetical protein
VPDQRRHRGVRRSLEPALLRDIVFADRRYIRELQVGSEEGIASNILAGRLKRLLELGLLTREDT